MIYENEPKPSRLKNLAKTGKGYLLSTANALEAGLHFSAKKVYEWGRMHGHTSNSPVKFETLKISGKENITSISIPFQLNKKWIPAIKNRKVLDLYDSKFPHLLLQLQDPHKDMTGEEVLNIEPRGEIKEILDGSGKIMWRLWFPGEEIALWEDGQEAVIKPQAELTAVDIIEYFSTSILQQSKGRIKVSNSDLYQAFSIISKDSPALSRRWQILTER